MKTFTIQDLCNEFRLSEDEALARLEILKTHKKLKIFKDQPEIEVLKDEKQILILGHIDEKGLVHISNLPAFKMVF